MSDFIKRVDKFRQSRFQEHADHYQKLKNGQTPHTFLITCADSRLCPQEMTNTTGGEIFVIRNAGNLVPAYDADHPTNEGVTLEYGICALGIPELVVCGHASCGAMAGLCDTSKVEPLPIVFKALENYKNHVAAQIEGKSLEEVIPWNVNQQLKNVYSYPFIQERLESGALKVYGMVYDFVTAEVTHRVQLEATGELSGKTWESL